MAAIIYKLSYFEKQSLTKKVFLKILRSSQKNTCVGVSYLINLQGWCLQLYYCYFIKKETLASVFSCEFSETFKNTSGDCFFILKISLKVTEFTSAVD